jgi:hypothetical protein
VEPRPTKELVESSAVITVGEGRQMCGSLRLENEKNVTPVGERISSRHLESASGKQQSYVWDGFARTDGSRDQTKSMADQWNSKEWKVSIIHVDSFTEHHRPTGETYTFKPKDNRIYRLGAIISDNRGTLRILTRPSKTQEEKNIHGRMPSRVPINLSLKEYVEALNTVTGGSYEPAEEQN